MKKHYEKILLCLGLTCFLSALVLIFVIGNQSPRLTAIGPADPPPVTPIATHIEENQKAITLLERPIKIDGTGASLVGPELIERRSGIGKLSINRGQDRCLVTGIPNSWLRKHGLPEDNPQSLFDDPDGDGFSTVEEYNPEYEPGMENPPVPHRNSTDPRDANSYPPPHHGRMFFIERRVKSYAISFRARPDDKLFQINRLAPVVRGERRSLVASAGDRLWNRFQVLGYDAARDELQLFDQEQNANIRLPRRQNLDLSREIAMFKLFLAGKPAVSGEAGEGEILILPGVKKHKYKIESIEEDKVTIKLNEMSITRPLMTDEQIRRKLGE